MTLGSAAARACALTGARRTLELALGLAASLAEGVAQLPEQVARPMLPLPRGPA